MATVAPRAGDAEQDQMGRKHVFVVNNAPDFLDLVRELLQEESYNVTTTNFVPDTFDQIATVRPAALIVDLAVGEGAGWDLLDRLQGDAVTNGIPVMVVSTSPKLLARAKDQQDRFGGDKFVAKPFDIDDVLDGVRSLVGDA
jgi:DNA-binding response OmpR family regulator